jgi:raffinose/stachyose/melibiose transport system permease protein
MSVRRLIRDYWLDLVGLVVVGLVFIVPFVFILLTASKTAGEAALLEFSLPTRFQLVENITRVMTFANNRMLLALANSALLTVSSVTGIVLIAALVAYVMQRRSDRVAASVGLLLFMGLVLPPAVAPTVFFLQKIGLYKTIFSLVLIEIALALPFAVVILRAFIGSIPREIDEAAIMDGASPLRLFFSIILPLLRPALVTIIVTCSIAVYNDFANPLYFLPGARNVTAQLTMFSYMGQFGTQWNLVFANVAVLTVLPLVMFMLFQRQIVSGMTSGAVKG